MKQTSRIDGKVTQLNISAQSERERNILPGVNTTFYKPELEHVDMKSEKIISLDERFPGMRGLDNSRVSREVVLAHDFPEKEKRETFFAAERYRLLCSRVLQVSRSTKSQIFLVTSAVAEEGKTLTITNLAFGLGSVEGKRTLLVDLDLRRPSMHRLLGVRPEPGDCVFLEKDCDWKQSLISLRPNLHVMLALNPADRPDELLHSDAMQNFLEEARKQYDLILIDSAPLLVAVDTHVLVSMVDQALLVVRADKTPIDCAREAIGILGSKALGCVLNGVKRMKYEEYYRSYYGVERRA